MFTGPEIVSILEPLGFTHVVWVPDSALGTWESSLLKSSKIKLLRVCREGEAWPLAAGLHLGGKQPLIVMQCTGFFESGDALRNALFDLNLPLIAIIGVRNYLDPKSNDSAKRFTEPVLKAWGVDYVVVGSEAEKARLGEFIRQRLQQRKPGIVLIGEGRG
jgi:sulfopyruvate decarboxylase TPP-binding subunit